MTQTRRGHLAHFLARLSGRLHLERLAALEAKVAKFGRAQREDLSAARRQLDRIAGELSTRAGAAQVRDVQRRVDEVGTSLTQQDRGFSTALERARQLDEQGIDDRRFARRVEQFLRHDRTIIVGPWTGEVGFELLYWVPFVRWVATTYGLPPERLFVISRSGTAAWYGGLASRYADVFTYFTPDEFRVATKDAKKQRRVGGFDAQVMARVVAAHQLEGAALLHPGMMYRLFAPFWKELATATRVEAYSRQARIGAVAAPPPDGLPAEYVAARFYFSDCFPDTLANRAFVTSTLEAIGRQTPVVLLNTPFAVDDHRDLAPAGQPLITIGNHMAPDTNLAVQTAVMTGARAFVGTYGGYAYLAPYCGVPSLAFYSEPTFKSHHLFLAQRVFEQLGEARLVAVDVASLPLIGLGLPALSVAPS